MTKFFAVLILIRTVSYGQTKPSIKTSDTTAIHQLSFDTNKIAILSIDRNNPLFKDAEKMQLTNQNLKAIAKILNDCIYAHNIKRDKTKKISEFIDLKKYKLQYVPFTSPNGQKKVYVNAFRDFNVNFNLGWKKYLIQVYDCGSCYFHLIINLTKSKCEEFYTMHHR